MKKDAINKLRGMHSHHVGVYFKLYYLCKDNQVAEIMSDNIALHIASIFINPGISMREAKIQQEALALDVAFTALEKANLVKYEVDQIVVHELYKAPQSRNEKLREALGGTWNEWIEYKQSNKPYKTAKTETIAYNQLMKACENDERLAADVVLNAIACQWMGLNADICIRRWNDAKETFNKLAPITKVIKEQNDKIGRISRQDLYEWIDKE